MHVAVAGAGGFIGRHMVTALAAARHEVSAFTRRLVDLPGCRLVVAEGGGIDAYRDGLSGRPVDAFINLAATGVNPGQRDLDQLLETNTLLPAQLVKLAAESGCRAFIQIGSSAEYAAIPHSVPMDEASPLERSALYGASKAAGSLMGQASGRAAGIPVAVLRAFNVFGPGEAPHRLLPSLHDRLGRGEKVALSAGSQIRDFLYVHDACAAIMRMLAALIDNPGLAGEYNLGSGQGVSVADFARAAAQAMSADPALLGFGELPLRPDDLPFVVAATGKIERVVGPVASSSLSGALDRYVEEMSRRG